MPVVITVRNGICSGACKYTCTPDGRKYGTLAGSAGRTTIILDDNILCNAADPYLHTFNVLVHEFTHSVHTYGVDAAMKKRITNSYNAARAHRTWEMSSYSMSSEGEYLAQGAAAYFNTNRGISHGNYMNEPEQFSKFTAESKHPLPAHSTRTSFKHKYVYCNGGIADYKSGTTIDITATTSVSGTAHTKAAQIIARMVKNMPSAICNSVAGQVKIGVFTKSEGMMIYPYNHYVADRAECRGICSGACKNTCTPDGRKYGTLAGSAGRTTTILDDNILCNAADPYLHTFNVLVHEFTHSVHTYGVDAAMKTRITNSYNAARAHRTWEMSSYSMSSEGEYLAQGAAAYFNTNRGISHGNYMNE
ncbi:Hypothetical predicted protein [Mytilus galloprovincialis]|uniref:Uncharacterized protein n=1 Tax=Mytilus galloprovincialis TaxID=29158 RepID=A0A8B6E1N9_MYTGA|nr:Hypothetical predicted protein [Mytilus galloprovincialis]